MAIARAELAVYEQFDVDESCKQQNESVVLGDTQLYAGRYTTPILPPFDVLHPAADDKSSRPQPSYSLQPAWSSSSPVVSGQQSTSNTQSFRSAAATTSLTSAAGTVQGREVRPPIMSVVLDSQHSMTYDSNLLPVQSSMHSLPNLRLSGPDVAPQVPSLSYVNQYSAGQLSDPNTRFHSNGDTMDTLLSETLKRSQLPKLDLPVFAGDPIEFQQWLGSFENIIEDAVSDPAKRLHYLMQYTTGSVKMLVSGHALNQTEAGYGAAKAELVKEFGDPYILARAYLKRIEAWKSIPANDPSSLKVFSAFLKNCRGSMPSLRHLQQLNTDLYLQKIVGKLSVPLQVSWRKALDQLEQSNKDISFSDLVDFIECQARIAKHPVFSASALQEAEGRVKQGSNDLNTQSFSGRTRVPMRQNRSVLATNAAESNSALSTQCAAAVPQSIRRESRTCPKCMKSHDLDDCEAYLNLAVEESFLEQVVFVLAAMVAYLEVTMCVLVGVGVGVKSVASYNHWLT